MPQVNLLLNFKKAYKLVSVIDGSPHQQAKMIIVVLLIWF